MTGIDLGDAWDDDNPVGYRAVLAADEAGEPFAAGEAHLRGAGLHHHFVPAAQGGAFVTADAFARTMRDVFRRDAALGVGYGVTSFIAAMPVWTSGDPVQQQVMADLLLGGGRAAAGFTEWTHGADFSRTDVRGRRVAGGWRVSGAKHMINNIARADLVTLFTRTDDRPGSRSHSNLLVNLRSGPAGHHRILPRYRTSGMRTCQLGGVDFTDMPVPDRSVIGGCGDAMETVLKAFQVTRCVLPGMVIGVLDSQLRLAVQFAAGRRLYKGTVADLPHARSVLTGAFVDVLITDALATVGARALHVLPEQGSVLSAAVKYLVPKVLQEASYELSSLLGASYYLREGEYAAFGKHARDLPVAVLAHASAAVCQATVIPQLPRLARRSWADGARPAPPAALFDVTVPLGELDPAGLAVNNRGVDTVTATLIEAVAHAGDDRLRPYLQRFVDELALLRTAADALSPREQTVVAGPGSFALAHRYSLVLAAAACTGVWRHQPAGTFLAGTDWLIAALARLEARINPVARPLWITDAPLPASLFTELTDRHERDRDFDLTG
jgi:alkylation response protein AidB-like acyl-CoA dehydrogenase